MYKLSSFSRVCCSLFSRSGNLQSRCLEQPARLSSKSRSFTVGSWHGQFLPWYKATQLKGIKKGFPPPLLTIPCAYNSVSPMDLAKDIAAVRNADGYLNLYNQFKSSTGMTQVNRITILHRIAKFATEGPRRNFGATKKSLKVQRDIFTDLLNNIAVDFGSCKPRDLSSIIWALGKIRENVAWFVAECEKEILRRDVNSFKTPAVCQLLNGFASLELKGSPFFARVEQRILQEELKMKDFENRGLAAALWSFTKTGNGSKELFEKFEQEILFRDVKKFSSRQLAQFLWAFTEREMQCDKLFEVTEQEIQQEQQLIKSLSDHGIKMLLWSFAKNGKGSVDLYNDLGTEVLERGIQDFDTGELALLVWSFAKRCPKMDALFDLAEEEFNGRAISDFRNHELSLILWSFAESGNCRVDLFKACQEEILSRNLTLFKTAQLSQIAWAFGRAKIPSTELFTRIEKVVMGNIAAFSDSELCMIARGFAQATAGTQKLFKLLEEEILDRNLLMVKPDFLPEVVWVFSNCSYNASLLFDAAEKELLQCQNLSAYQDYEVHILRAAFLKAGRDMPPVLTKIQGASTACSAEQKKMSAE